MSGEQPATDTSRMDPNTVITIITSAAVGTLISSAVTLFSQWRERAARRKELLLSRAIDLAFARRKFVTEAADRAAAPAYLKDDVSFAADYYQILAHLMDKGKLPDAFLAREAESARRQESDSLDDSTFSP
jgi:hypothetical protein